MKCYYHHEIDAVAICKSCHRALCDSCAIDVHPGTACTNRCEKDVEDLNVMIESGMAQQRLSKSVLQKTGKAYKYNAVAMLLAGLLFLFLGIFLVILKGKYYLSIFAILGLIFLLWSYFSYQSGKQIQSTDEEA